MREKMHYGGVRCKNGIFKEYCCCGHSYLIQGSHPCHDFEDGTPVNDEEDGILRF
jgi:hypothetical protein